MMEEFHVWLGGLLKPEYDTERYHKAAASEYLEKGWYEIPSRDSRCGVPHLWSHRLRVDEEV